MMLKKSALFWDITTRRRVTSQRSAELINIAAEAWNQGCWRKPIRPTWRYSTNIALRSWRKPQKIRGYSRFHNINSKVVSPKHEAWMLITRLYLSVNIIFWSVCRETYKRQGLVNFQKNISKWKCGGRKVCGKQFTFPWRCFPICCVIITSSICSCSYNSEYWFCMSNLRKHPHSY